MKCILCNGELKKKEIEYKELDISLGKFLALVCNKCNEVFFDEETAEKIQKKSKELNLFGIVKKTKVALVGNSLAIRIPKEIAKFVGLKKEELVNIIPKNKKEITIMIN